MNRKNLTRNALFTSIISLLLCVSMLVGTTFAWFTDEVVTGMNTIAAGNLDVELLANGTKVDSSTALFDDVELWEPGVVVYENLQVANVGTLALKYQMTLNFGEENNLNGHKLSEVLKVAVVDKIASGSTREQVLNAAKGSGKTLTNFYLTGELVAGASSDEKSIVIYWDPNENAVDNLYNANNGQVTSDGQPLHIKFGINLQATQMMHEEDSFDNTYDKEASILPKANVNDLGARKQIATINGWGSGAVKQELDLPFVLQFEPNETVTEAQDSAYRYWHADYVVKADKAVKADSMALVGYYQAFCDAINDKNWVAMQSDADVAANTEIRLVELLGATVNYEEICNFGNDGTGFLCSATDLTGANAGTTITVELRMYEVPAQGECANGGGCKHPTTACETGNYEVIGTYSYTFGSKTVSTADELAAALTSDWENISVVLANDIDVPVSSLSKYGQTPGSGEYKMGGDNTKNISIDLNGHKLTLTTGYMTAIGAQNENATVTIKNGSMNGVGNNATTWNINDLIFANCNYKFENVTFDKEVALTNTGKNVTMKNVVINGTGDYYALWIQAEGQNVNINGLTVNTPGRGIKIDEQYAGTNVAKVTLSISSSKFNTAKKAAIMVKSAAGADITANSINIAGVAADSTNVVWVDVDAAAYADLVTVTGATKIVEP